MRARREKRKLPTDRGRVGFIIAIVGEGGVKRFANSIRSPRKASRSKVLIR